jgi:hypothetical protein
MDNHANKREKRKNTTPHERYRDSMENRGHKQFYQRLLKTPGCLPFIFVFILVIVFAIVYFL